MNFYACFDREELWKQEPMFLFGSVNHPRGMRPGIFISEREEELFLQAFWSRASFHEEKKRPLYSHQW